jgi:hypothetical protein
MITTKSHIEDLVGMLGTGLIAPVAYDTAWVARVPQADDLTLPAYPNALDWLRKHQLPDGSWGTVQPFYAHGNTVSTLAAILALVQWNNACDQERIARGVEALWKLAPQLKTEPHESIAFELLLPAMQEEAAAHGLKLPVEDYAPYEVLSRKKRNLILTFANQQGYDKPRAWWFSLEMIGGLSLFQVEHTELVFNDSMLTNTGSIGLSPAATAFYLTAGRLRGVDSPLAANYLYDLARHHNYSIPHLSPMDGTELAFGIDYFLKAGIPADHPVLAPAFKRLSDRWQPDQGFGYSAYFIPDADDTAIALRALQMAGYRVDPAVLLNFFGGEYVKTYPDERDPSVSCNIHALLALRAFPDHPEVQQAAAKTLAWLEANCQYDGPLFDDKWHFSPYYAISRAVFSLEGINDTLAERCVDWMVENQRNNGGFGAYEHSTAEETAHAVLALSYWYRQGHNLPKSVLLQAKRYMEQEVRPWPTDELWIGKTLYCQTIAVQSAVAGAAYALQQID